MAGAPAGPWRRSRPRLRTRARSRRPDRTPVQPAVDRKANPEAAARSSRPRQRPIAMRSQHFRGEGFLSTSYDQARVGQRVCVVHRPSPPRLTRVPRAEPATNMFCGRRHIVSQRRPHTTIIASAPGAGKTSTPLGPRRGRSPRSIAPGNRPRGELRGVGSGLGAAPDAGLRRRRRRHARAAADGQWTPATGVGKVGCVDRRGGEGGGEGSTAGEGAGTTTACTSLCCPWRPAPHICAARDGPTCTRPAT